MARSGTNLKCFVNGTQVGSTATSEDNLLQDGIAIGMQYNEASFFHGYIDELRVSKGIARWTSSFTPPTAPYALDAGPAGVKKVAGITLANCKKIEGVTVGNIKKLMGVS